MISYIVPEHSVEEIREVITRANKEAADKTSKNCEIFYILIITIGKFGVFQLFCWVFQQGSLILLKASNDFLKMEMFENSAFILLAWLVMLIIIIDLFIRVCSWLNKMKYIFIRKGYIVESPFKDAEVLEYYTNAFELISFIEEYEHVVLFRDDTKETLKADGIDNGFTVSKSFYFGKCYIEIIRDNKLNFNVLDQFFEGLIKSDPKALQMAKNNTKPAKC